MYPLHVSFACPCLSLLYTQLVASTHPPSLCTPLLADSTASLMLSVCSHARALYSVEGSTTCWQCQIRSGHVTAIESLLRERRHAQAHIASVCILHLCVNPFNDTAFVNNGYCLQINYALEYAYIFKAYTTICTCLVVKHKRV